MKCVDRFAVAAVIFLGLGACTPAEQRYIAEDYGISLRFPKGVAVCPSLSGDHPHGFHANLDEPCGKGRPGARAIGWWSDFNSVPEPRMEAYIGRCVPPKGPAQHFRIANFRSLVCEERRGGSITLTVHAERGRLGAGFAEDADKPYIFYDVTLITTDNEFSRDLQAFQRFLNDARLLRVE